MADDEIPRQNPLAMQASTERVLRLLEQGELEVVGMMPWSSNYTLLTKVDDGDLNALAIYKPRRGERPLWDFARGTLCHREVASFLVNETLGWGLVPPTVLRDGPYGIGSVQLFIDADFDVHLLMMEKEGCYQQQILRLVAFDVIVNNADRKSGHCLKGSDGRMWAIDHGITFHTDYKLRTVLWDYVGDPLPPGDLANLYTLQAALRPGAALRERLTELLAGDEMKALQRRVDRLVASGVYPHPGPGPNVPWPPV
jgi:uncharacterized repeat protein (TIGR03843 family)